MVETYRTTSKINKQQNVKGSKNYDTSFRIKEVDHNGPENSHTQTHIQNEQPYLWIGTAKPQKVTGDIKADRQTSKEHPGKHRGKTRQEKGTPRKWICTMPCITLHHHETWMQQKHSKTSMLNKQQRLSPIRT